MRNIKTIKSIKHALCLLLLALAALQLNAEVRFTGENPKKDEERFRQALTLIARSDPGNGVLSIEEMKEIVDLKFVALYNFSGSLEVFFDGRNPEMIILQAGKDRDNRDVAATLAHEGKHFLNSETFPPFITVVDTLPPSLHLIFETIDEASAFYSEIKIVEKSFSNRLRRAPPLKPAFDFLPPEASYEIGSRFILSIGLDLKKWMKKQKNYKALSAADFEKEYKKEFLKLFLELPLFPTKALDRPGYDETSLLAEGQSDNTITIPSWANPQFAYLLDKDARDILLKKAIEVCFGDIEISPEECDTIFNETLARIDAYRADKNLPTITQLEHTFSEYAGNANNPQWLGERGLNQVIINPSEMENPQEVINAILGQ